jgi:type II secretory pathway pseudopilin PulG
MRKIKKNKNVVKKGFTLSELLLAATILSFAFGTLIVSFVACFLLNETNRNLSIAVTHAQYVMEEIRDTASTVAGFGNLTTQINSGNWDWNSTTVSSRGLSTLSNETIDSNVTGTDLLDVTVTVNWQNRGRNRNTVLETLITEP